LRRARPDRGRDHQARRDAPAGPRARALPARTAAVLVPVRRTRRPRRPAPRAPGLLCRPVPAREARRVIQRGDPPRTPCPFVLVTGGKGGVGKSTLAANLAVVLAQ